MNIAFRKDQIVSDHDERFAQIEQTWFDARDNYEDDRAKATTSGEKKGVDQNHNKAFEAYAEALDVALNKTATAVETAYQSLVDANKAVQKARAEREWFPALLNKLTAATTASRGLLAKAT